MATARRVLEVSGTVQGVGFRPFVHREARSLGLAGHVANDGGIVVVDVQGPADALDELTRRLVEEPPPLAAVRAVHVRELPLVPDATAFTIDGSRLSAAADVAVTPDIGTCDACLAELVDPADRRHRHPFISCTDCGPRYTIIRSVPYDRDRTTMSVFAMCAACRREYEDPSDRRFHAEPIACHGCGPRLELLDRDGRALAVGDAGLRGAVDLLRGGAVVAVKGLGGYHLAVDATDAEAVSRLRRRKGRDDKAFAVMVADEAAAEALCELSPAAAAALRSAQRPIVLAPRRGGARVSDAVAPGLAELGLVLPYTPLHHLLVTGVGRPLVMTSGNRSDEPIVHDDAEVLDRLGPLVDAVLTHDRPIHIRCDDSIVRATEAGVQLLRRARGEAPAPFQLPRPTGRAVLAVGAELKATVAIAAGRHLVVSHHLGDLEQLAAHRAFQQAICHLRGLTGIEPEVVVHDLHPEYLSTKWATEQDLPTVAVQHHHAHVASCLVEHGRDETVLGVAFDGLGLGSDGSLWGGEILVADLAGFRRVGHLHAVAQPGGAAATREPWRMAMVWLEEALGPEEAARYGSGVDERSEAVSQLIRLPDTPTTTSAGRLFDAVAALLGVRASVSYEGQAAMELESLAAGIADVEAPAYEIDVSLDGDIVVLDPAPMIAQLWLDATRGGDRGAMSAGFHAAVATAVVRSVLIQAERHHLGTAVLTGGVFQNRRLSRLTASALRRNGIEVLEHGRIPPNDGGISVGQAAVAAARFGLHA